MKNKKIDLSKLKLSKDTITNLSLVNQSNIIGASAGGKVCAATVTKNPSWDGNCVSGVIGCAATVNTCTCVCPSFGCPPR